MGSETDKVYGSEAVKKIHKKFGPNIFRKASEFDTSPSSYWSTGIFALDYALGGGFPIGKSSIVWGPKSSAKTTTFLLTIARAQRSCVVCCQPEERCTCKKPTRPVSAFMDVEGTLDLGWAQRLGVRLDEMLLSQPEYAEQTLDIAEGVILNGCDIMAIDSIAFLTPQKELEESVSKDLMGVQARALGKGVRKFVSALNTIRNKTGRAPTLLFTNQIRMKLGVMFGSPETQPGGNAPGYMAATETRMSSGKYDMDEVLGRPAAVGFNFRVEKNKTHVPKMEGTFKLQLTDSETRKMGDILNDEAMVSIASKMGLLEGAGSKWTLVGETFKSKSLINRELIVNPEFHARVWQALMALSQ